MSDNTQITTKKAVKLLVKKFGTIELNKEFEGIPVGDCYLIHIGGGNHYIPKGAAVQLTQ